MISKTVFNVIDGIYQARLAIYTVGIHSIPFIVLYDLALILKEFNHFSQEPHFHTPFGHYCLKNH